MLKKIISGGQTGADQGGLEAGRELGLVTGGTATLGWRTEDGPQQKLLEGFGLKESGVSGYPFRTEMNVVNSDATVIFGNLDSPGSKLTLSYCKRYIMPYFTNPPPGCLRRWVDKYHIKVLNVAGNRESKKPGIQQEVRKFLVKEFSDA